MAYASCVKHLVAHPGEHIQHIGGTGTGLRALQQALKMAHELPGMRMADSRASCGQEKRARARFG